MSVSVSVSVRLDELDSRQSRCLVPICRQTWFDTRLVWFMLCAMSNRNECVFVCMCSVWSLIQASRNEQVYGNGMKKKTHTQMVMSGPWEYLYSIWPTIPHFHSLIWFMNMAIGSWKVWAAIRLAQLQYVQYMKLEKWSMECAMPNWIHLGNLYRTQTKHWQWFYSAQHTQPR